ncbi:hypothetical protein D3C75_1091540 [compost metagenome]
MDFGSGAVGAFQAPTVIARRPPIHAGQAAEVRRHQGQAEAFEHTRAGDQALGAVDQHTHDQFAVFQWRETHP